MSDTRELWEHDAWEIADGVRAGRLRAADVLEVYVERIAKLDPELNAWCDLDVEGARTQASAIDAAVARGDDPGSLAGVPVGVKELAAARGLSDTHGSMLYAGERADHDCTEVARLRAAGAVIVGKTTSPEFGSINWTHTKVHGVTRNPWDPTRTPGGSSGGSGAAVAAGQVPIATGSDGGGSIRIPSSYCGLFGFKVTFGRIGREPESFDASLTSVPGPMARSVRDAARYVDVVAGPTVNDPTSLPRPAVPYERALFDDDGLAEQLRGLRAGWSATLGFAVPDPQVAASSHAAAVALAADAGLRLVDVDVRIPRPGRAWSLLSSLAMAADHLERARGRFDELTPVVRAGLAWSERVTIDDITRAYRRRDDVLRAIAAVFDEVDVLFTPTTATTAFVAEGPPPVVIDGQEVGGMGSVPYTAPFNISGQPAVSIPCGFDTDGLPIGLQAVTRRHDEPIVLALGLAAERTRPWRKLAP
jgi:aspartyl-tRNA(Asn)/glutamyl-tRNA(Gln) amidotransferase subunit A